MKKLFNTVGTNVWNNLFNALSWSSLSARMGTPKLTLFRVEQSYRPTGIFRDACARASMTGFQVRTYAASEMHKMFRHMSNCWAGMFKVGPK